ncbi:MAG: Do family serine endopeptidase, partial [Gammaproteobacteria bacterium]|nr:Do family serine endopeptidase [Gammaproteobacteria bacterium]
MLQRPFVRRSLAAVSVLLVITACQPRSSSAGGATGLQAAQASTAASPAAATPGVQGRMMLPDFASLVQQHGPAVVNITTRGKRIPVGRGMSPNDPMFEFFRRFGIPGMPGAPSPDGRGAPQGQDDGDGEGMRQPGGEGSGFIVSADGLLLTNAHVVDDADEIMVKLIDRREFKAKLIGLDKATDVAVLRIDAKGLPTVRIGDPKKLRPGEWAIAIGNPLGLDNTVTAGIVSAKQRDTGDYLPFIQTDVAINPGNSGGPLLNLRGEVVGINSQIYSRSGGFMGISFAIPIDEAMRVSDQLRTNGRVIRGRIGVQIAPVTKEVAEAIGLGKPTGALVQSVEAGGPADKAGVEAGDIITRVDGKLVEKSGDLPRLVGGTRPGSKAILQVFRRGVTKELTATVGEFEAERPTRRAQAEPSGAAPVKSALGITASDLTEAQKRELKVKGGVRVDAVEGAAARAGLR